MFTTLSVSSLTQYNRCFQMRQECYHVLLRPQVATYSHVSSSATDRPDRPDRTDRTDRHKQISFEENAGVAFRSRTQTIPRESNVVFFNFGSTISERRRFLRRILVRSDQTVQKGKGRFWSDSLILRLYCVVHTKTRKGCSGNWTRDLSHPKRESYP